MRRLQCLGFPARKLAPALAAGYAVILCPSSQMPGTAMVLFECRRAGGLPEGVADLIMRTAEETYAPLMAAAEVPKVSLTGSTRVGRR